MIGSLLRKMDETISWDIKVIPLRCIDNKASLQQICSIRLKWIESPMIPHVFPRVGTRNRWQGVILKEICHWWEARPESFALRYRCIKKSIYWHERAIKYDCWKDRHKKKTSPIFTKTSNRGRNRDVSKPTVCIPSPQYILNKEKGNDEQETTKGNVTSEYAKLPRQTARNYQPPETQQIEKDFIQRGNSDIDTPSQQAPQKQNQECSFWRFEHWNSCINGSQSRTTSWQRRGFIT